MKKLYATLFAAALGVGAVSAQQLTTVWTKHYDMEVGDYDPEDPDWSSPGAIKTQPGMRNAIGVEGKLYGIDMRTMTVTAFDRNSAYKAYDLPSLAGQTITYTSLTEDADPETSPDFYGSLISRDDAGNLLIGHGQGTGAACNTWTVLDRNSGATKRLVADMGENALCCLPIEMINRAFGDVTKEGYLYIPPTSVFWPEVRQFSWGQETGYMDVQRAKVMSFKGDGTIGGISMTGSATGPMPLGCWYFNSAAPWCKDFTAFNKIVNRPNMSVDQTFILYSKLQGGCLDNGIYEGVMGTLNPSTEYNVMSPFTVAGSDLLGSNYSMYEGFDTFELGTKRYYVVAFADEPEFRTDGLVQFAVFDRSGQIYKDSNGDLAIWTYDGEWYDEGIPYEGVSGVFMPSGSMSINIEKVDDSNVNIYIWAQAPGSGVVAGVFNFGNGVTGIDEVAVDGIEAAPVFYNLNGIRIEEPERGIFIEKRGSKVTKVIR